MTDTDRQDEEQQDVVTRVLDPIPEIVEIDMFGTTFTLTAGAGKVKTHEGYTIEFDASDGVLKIDVADNILTEETEGTTLSLKVMPPDDTVRMITVGTMRGVPLGGFGRFPGGMLDHVFGGGRGGISIIGLR